MHKRNSLSPGFTIVELLIVIVVIAILAAISVVAYRGLQDRARASEVSSALTQSKKKLELYKVDNGSYPTTGNLASAGITSNDGSFQYTSDGATFCLTATSGTVSYMSTNTTNPTPGGCAGHGQGGVAAITNLAKNPRGVGSLYMNSNNSTVWEVVRNITVPATSDGITTAAQSRWVAGADNGHVLTMYDVDGLGNTGGITRSISLWVRVNATGYSVSNSPNWATQNIPADTWVRVQTTTPFSGSSWSGIAVRKSTGSTAPSDRAWVTGIMAVEGSQHYSFADGISPNWIWNGTLNNSSSTGPAL